MTKGGQWAIAFAILVLPSAAGPLHAQSPPAAEAVVSTDLRPQFEPSYLVTTIAGSYAPQSNDRILLEANVAPPFYLWHGGHAAVVITPKIVLRQFTGFSWPVRPPSFMPRGTVYWWWLGRNGIMNYLSVMVSHHSNGQSAPHRLPDGTLNHLDGNFSTYYAELAWQQRLPLPVDVVWRWALNFDIPGAYDRDEMRDYPKVRPSAGLSTRWGRMGQWSTSVTSGVLIGAGGPSLGGGDRFFGEANLSWALPWASEMSLFADVYFGRDYYNNNYDQYRKLVRFGVATGPGRSNPRGIQRSPGL